jgi:ATP-binding cassette subfamily F protein 3
MFQNALLHYSGTIILVSHDRYFLDNLVGRVLELRDGRLHEYTGNYSYFIQKREDELAAMTAGREADAAGPDHTSPAAAEAPRKTGKTKEERRQEAEERNRRAAIKKDFSRELHELEGEIVALEGLTARNQSLLCAPEVLHDSQRIQALMKELKEAERRLKTLLPRWEEVMNRLEEL